jgi:hypothetical protein
MSGEDPKVRPAMDSMKKQLRDSGVPEKKAEQIVQQSARRYDTGQGARKK